MRPELEGDQDFGAMTGSLEESGRFAAGARQIASKLRSYAFGRSRIYTPTPSAEEVKRPRLRQKRRRSQYRDRKIEKKKGEAIDLSPPGD